MRSRAVTSGIERVALLFLAGVCVTGTAQAQVSGRVTDNTGRPIASAEVRVAGIERFVRTDDSGAFAFPEAKHPATVRVRAIGFIPAQMRTERTGVVAIVLEAAPALDTVRVVAREECPRYDFAGFECRRRNGGGYFRTGLELAEHRTYMWADMLEGFPGLRRVPIRGPNGGDVRVTGTPSRCLIQLWNGNLPMRIQGAPHQPETYWTPQDVVAIEYYENFRKVPPEYSGVAWPVDQREGCALIVYWLKGARRR